MTVATKTHHAQCDSTFTWLELDDVGRQNRLIKIQSSKCFAPVFVSRPVPKLIYQSIRRLPVIHTLAIYFPLRASSNFFRILLPQTRDVEQRKSIQIDRSRAKICKEEFLHGIGGSGHRYLVMGVLQASHARLHQPTSRLIPESRHQPQSGKSSESSSYTLSFFSMRLSNPVAFNTSPTLSLLTAVTSFNWFA